MSHVSSPMSIKIFISLLTAIILFHLGIVFKFIPYNIAWGGRLQNDSQMYVFEAFSILVNLFLIWILLMKGNMVSYKFSDRFIRIVLWMFLVLFVLNTIGNIFAVTTFEKFFAVLTGLSAVLILKILNSKF